MIQLLSPLAYRVLPWKNGGGSTTEIAVDPDGGTWEDFNWRVAIADIREAGPFSSFPGIDRSILLLDAPRGTQMELRIDGQRARMLPREFVDFTGESSTESVLFGEPLAGAAIRDFNVMSRRGEIRHRRGCQSIGPGAIHRMGGVDTRIVYVADGSAEVVQLHTAHELVAGDSAIARGDDTLEVRGGAEGAQLVWVVFSPVGD